MANTYNGAVNLYGSAIYNGLTCLGWSNEDITSSPIINRMADHGEHINTHILKGEIIQATADIGYGLTDSALFIATKPFRNGQMNNIIAGAAGMLLGTAAGGSIQGMFGAVAGAAGLGYLGYLYGDDIMNALNYSFEDPEHSQSKPPTLAVQDQTPLFHPTELAIA